MRVDPDDPRIYVARAAAWNESGSPQYAIADASRALRLDKGSLDALIERGNALINSGQGADAAEDFTQALELAPAEDRPQLMFARGRAQMMTRRFDAAIDDFTAVIKAEPGAALAYNERGFAYSVAGRPAKALRDLNHAIELEPNNPGFYLNRGSAFFNMNRKDQAAADWEKAYALGKKSKGIVAQLKQRFGLLGRGLPGAKGATKGRAAETGEKASSPARGKKAAKAASPEPAAATRTTRAAASKAKGDGETASAPAEAGRSRQKTAASEGSTAASQPARTRKSSR